MAEKRTVGWTSAGAERRLVVELSADEMDCFDSHCHLDLLFRRDSGRCHTLSEFKTQNGRFKNFAGCVAVFNNPRSWESAEWATILGENDVWGAFGCHPHKANLFEKKSYEFLARNAQNSDKFKAVGEIGLDYSRNNHVEHGKQKQVFSQQLQLAVECGKPVVLHIREAERDAHELVRRYVPRGHRIHRHCVTGDIDIQKMYLQDYSNCYMGFTALITNPNAVNARRAIDELPLERMVLETDAPHFVPHSLRGDWRQSRPGMVELVAHEIARIKEMDKIKIAKQTTYNARRIYDLPL